MGKYWAVAVFEEQGTRQDALTESPADCSATVLACESEVRVLRMDALGDNTRNPLTEQTLDLIIQHFDRRHFRL